MIFTASDVSSLATSLEHWEWAEYASCALVALGCTGEYLAEFTDCWTGGPKDRQDRLAKRSTLLLISALALELICLVKTNSISGMLIGSLSDKARAAETKAQSAFDKSALAEDKAGNASTVAGDALTDSKTAKDAAGKAQEKVDAVARRAEEIDAGLAQTQFLISARHVENIKTLTEQLRQFKGQTVVLASYNADSEEYGICFVLKSITHDAEMNPIDQCGMWNSNGPPATGILVRGPDDNAVLSMAGMISSTGKLMVQSGPYGNVPKPATFVILVGPKSPFEIGQARGVRAPRVITKKPKVHTTKP